MHLTTVLFSDEMTWKITDIGLSPNPRAIGWTATDGPEGTEPPEPQAPENMAPRPTLSNKLDIEAFGYMVFEVIGDGGKLYRDALESRVRSRRHDSQDAITGKMRGALNKWLDTMKPPIQHRDSILKNLLATISIDPSARPTASELKVVLYDVLKPCPEVTVSQLGTVKRASKRKLNESS
jgi:hypothetical protein